MITNEDGLVGDHVTGLLSLTWGYRSPQVTAVKVMRLPLERYACSRVCLYGNVEYVNRIAAIA